MMTGGSKNSASCDSDQYELIRQYWNEHPFEYELCDSPFGTIVDRSHLRPHRPKDQF